MNKLLLPRYTRGYLDGMKKKSKPKLPTDPDYMKGFRMAKRDQKWMQKQEALNFPSNYLNHAI